MSARVVFHIKECLDPDSGVGDLSDFSDIKLRVTRMDTPRQVLEIKCVCCGQDITIEEPKMKCKKGHIFHLSCIRKKSLCGGCLE